MTVGAPAPALHLTGAYAPGAPRAARAAAPVLAAFDAQRLHLLARAAPPPARLLDVGAGRGRFVAAARAAGYDARGIEPFPREAVPHVTPAAIEDADVPPASLDVVTLWHVLEHLDDPAAALRRLAAWLRPGGVLLLGVPNLGSLQARVGGDRWYHFDLPRHRVHLTPAGARAALAAAGLQTRSVHHVLAEHNPFGMWQSAVNRLTLTPSWLYHFLKRNAPWRLRDAAVTAAALPLLPLAVLVELGAALARRGGTIAVLARRPPA